MDDDDDDDVMADAEYSPKSMDKKHEEVWTCIVAFKLTYIKNKWHIYQNVYVQIVFLQYSWKALPI